MKRKKKTSNKSQWTQDFIPLKDIRNRIIETTDGRYLKILEIEPINFLLRSSEEQYNIISSFASWLKISPVQLQFKSVTRRADSDKHVAMIREELAAEGPPAAGNWAKNISGSSLSSQRMRTLLPPKSCICFSTGNPAPPSRFQAD
jgi:hypothetical protein